MVSDFLIKIFEVLQDLVWGVPTIILILSLGIFFTVKTNFFQIRSLGLIFKKTIFSVFLGKKREKGGLSPLKTLATTLSATLGTGSIAGVATAIVSGGAGSIFWMWISAIFGTMTSYIENLLGVYYREKNSTGQFCGGTMYCFKNGFKNKKIATVLSTVFCFSCILASFGIGNAVQTNTIVGAIKGVNTSISENVIGIIVSVFVFFIIIFGTNGIANVTSVLLPIMAVFYFLGTITIIFKNISLFPKMIVLIMKSAFGFDAVLGGFSGIIIKNAIDLGVRRGIFSNEAGMGSTTIINSASNVKEPAEQGMWGIFEVVFDTLIVCSLTAFAILLSGLFDLDTGKLMLSLDGAELVTMAFKATLGNAAAWFIVISTLFFAFSSILGWSFYGIRCIEFLLGEKYVGIYKVLFSLAAYFGAVSELQFIWIMSDVFNGLMMIPNLICIIVLAPIGLEISRNYIDRNKYGEKIVPMLSFK